MTSKKGFALIEGLIALAIIIILGVVGLSAFTKYMGVTSIDASIQDIARAIDEARNLTLFSQGGISYGVHFESTKVVRFDAPSYIPDMPTNRVYLLDPHTRISYIFINGGGSNITFARLTGEPSATGTIVVSGVGGNAGQVATGTVNTSGNFELTNS